MSLTIWKFPLLRMGNELQLPLGGRVLSVQMQGQHVTLWALVDPGADTVKRFYDIYGTGWPIQGDPGTHVGTVQRDNGVWHVFERGGCDD